MYEAIIVFMLSGLPVTTTMVSDPFPTLEDCNKAKAFVVNSLEKKNPGIIIKKQDCELVEVRHG